MFEEPTELSEHPQHPSILKRGATALVVVDMQEPFVNSLFDRDLTVSCVVNLIRGCNILKVPIIASTQYAQRMGDIIPQIRHLLPPTPAHDKMAFDCCGSNSFNTALADCGATQVLICGVEAHICVCQTAHGLLARGYQVHVVTDAVCSRNEMDCKFGLDKMAAAGVIPSCVEMALFELMHEAGSPVFREVLAIVK